MVNIGILDLQGSIIEHYNLLSTIKNIKITKVKNISDLENIDGLIIPGGESTTLSKLLKIYNIFDSLKIKGQNGMPIWGTCAGMILLAKKVIDDSVPTLELMDISVKRNAYGSQLDSFVDEKIIPQISNNKIPLVFIRAPRIQEIEKNVEILLELNDTVVAVKQNNLIATSFHPELTKDSTFHKFFVNLCENYKNVKVSAV